MQTRKKQWRFNLGILIDLGGVLDVFGSISIPVSHQIIIEKSINNNMWKVLFGGESEIGRMRMRE